MGFVPAVTARSTSRVRVGAWLKLGRVSNLPTVWTNVLAATALCGETVAPASIAACCAVMAAFYVAGMILNDAFDARYDSVHRPARPIPSGAVSKVSALVVGFIGLTLAVVGTGAVAHVLGNSASVAVGLGALLASVIVGYDVYHKNNPFSPVVMGACRALVYLATSYALSGQCSRAVVVACTLQWAYIIGLTYAAKQEDLADPNRFWPVLFVAAAPVTVLLSALGVGQMGFEASRASTAAWTLAAVLVMAWSIGSGLRPLLRQPREVGLAVGRLIAGVAVLDAMLIATTGWLAGVALAFAGAILTRIAQRFVPGT